MEDFLNLDEEGRAFAEVTPGKVLSLRDRMLKYTPRKEQTQMVNFTMDAFKEGKKFVLMDAPVGIGKSYYAVMVMAEYLKKHPRAKFDVLTSTKILQSQYADDFDFINNLWGAANYTCDNYSCDCEVGQEFANLNKTKCSECPYDTAKEAFFKGSVSLTNYHMHVLYAMFAGPKLEERGADILIVDEAHEFDSVVSDFVSAKLNKAMLKKLEFEEKVIKQYEDLFRSIKTVEQYTEMLRTTFVPDLNAHRKNVMLQENTKSDKKKWIKLMKMIDNTVSKFELFLKEYEEDPSNWIFEIDDNKYSKGDRRGMLDLAVQPVWSKDYLEQYIWKRYKHVVLMSGTILDKKLFSFLNGLDEDKVAYMYLDSPFPKQNRKIYYMPVAKMNYDNKRKAFDAFVPWIHKIVKKNADNKGIIHTVSFELATWIMDELDKDKSPEGQKLRKRFLFHDSSTRDLVLRQHTASKEPTILVSPSMFTGVDLKDDLSRFQIILKIPYPNLGAAKIKKRKDIYPAWYGWRTVADIVQSYGRSVRNEQDWAETYILDAGFGNLMSYNGTFMPKYMKEAIVNINIK